MAFALTALMKFSRHYHLCHTHGVFYPLRNWMFIKVLKGRSRARRHEAFRLFTRHRHLPSTEFGEQLLLYTVREAGVQGAPPPLPSQLIHTCKPMQIVHQEASGSSRTEQQVSCQAARRQQGQCKAVCVCVCLIICMCPLHKHV